MSRKDYQLIADVISNSWFGSLEMRADLVSNLAEKLKKENPRFDEARFFKACGVKY